MRTSHKMDPSAAHPIPFPKRRETSAKLRELDEGLRSLREKLESEDEAASIARTAALLYVDLIARVHAFSAQLDRALDHQLFLAGRPFRENVKRASAALKIYERLSKMMLEATDGLFKCLGGQKVIALQAITRWAAHHPEARTMNSVLEEQIQRIAKSLANQSK